MEQTRLIYTCAKNAEGKTHYIDLFRGLCLMNAQNKNQFKRGKPLMIAGTIRMNKDTETIRAIKTVWPVKNALNKADDAWRRTLKSAGLRPKQLNTYGNQLRVAWDEGHHDVWCSRKQDGTSAVDAVPDDVELGYKTGQYNDAGLEFQVNAQLALDGALVLWGPSPTAGPTVYNVPAFNDTRAAVPLSGSVDVQDKYFTVFGSVGSVSSTILPILDTYLDSRINETRVEDTDMDDIPTADNDFVMMLAPGEEVADDVIENVRDEGRWRPYTTDSALNSTEVVTSGANVSGQDTPFVAPLGLLKWSPSTAESRLVIDIIAIGEM